MTQEEKAKAYDKVINKLRHFIAIGVDPLITMADVQDFFPELKESEEEMVEKIRKDIISYLNNRQITSIAESSATERWLAWLEKQGEQKSVDDLTQQEAMDIAVAKCFEQSEQKPTLRERYDNIAKSEWFKKVHEGMPVSDEETKWGDDDEQYLLVCKNALRKYQVSDKWDADIISKWLDDKLKQGEQKPKWTEEDERFLNDVDFTLFQYKEMPKERYWKIIDWLKSIKQRMEE